MDACMGILSTAKSCLLILHNRPFLRCNVDEECMKNVLSSLALVFSIQALIPGFDIRLSDAMGRSCKVYFNAEDQNQTKLSRE